MKHKKAQNVILTLSDGREVVGTFKEFLSESQDGKINPMAGAVDSVAMP